MTSSHVISLTLDLTAVAHQLVTRAYVPKMTVRSQLIFSARWVTVLMGIDRRMEEIGVEFFISSSVK